tara:strand:+ start:81776 stop:82585 length:810 start_codon:yes stop_codon:yes gene_type:complete
MKTLFIALILIYIVVCAAMYFIQDKLIFPAKAAPQNISTEGEVFISPLDNIKLESKIFKSDDENADVVILFTGNAQNALLVGKNIFEGYNEKSHIATMNYRSYGRSEGNPTQETLFADALAFTQYIKTTFPKSKMYIMGISLGTGVATYVAANLNVDGVLLFTPYDSLLKIAKIDYPYLPTSWLLKHPFNSLEYIQKITAPTAIMIAENDTVIPHVSTKNLIKHGKNIVHTQVMSGMSHTEYLEVRNLELQKIVIKKAMEDIVNASKKL